MLHSYDTAWIVRRDIDGVLQIEEDSFVQPWDEETLVLKLRDRSCIGVAQFDYDGAVAAYMIYSLRKTEYVIDRFAVRPGERREGRATELVSRLKERLGGGSARRSIVCDVPDVEVAGQLFLKAMGFVAVKVVGDVYRMEYVL